MGKYPKESNNVNKNLNPMGSRIGDVLDGDFSKNPNGNC